MSMSRSDFLTQYISPYQVWASGAAPGNVATPDEGRIASGWAVERPSHSLFNAIHKRTDEQLVRLEARIAFLEYYLGLMGVGGGMVLPPVVLSPTEGELIPAAGKTIHITTQPLSSVGAQSDTHASTDWKISTDAEGAFVLASEEGSQDLVEHTFSGLNLAPGTVYFVWARHNGLHLGVGPWARMTVWAN